MAVKRTTKAKIDVSKHTLVPPHKKLSEKDKKVLLEKYSITVNQLPVIFKSDAAISHLGVEPGDVIMIQRDSPTAGNITFYRGVIDG